MATILVIDDDAQLRQSFEKILKVEGHVVRTAASGETGCEMVADQAPDLVITDVRLPGIDGLEAFRRMREVEPKLPVIIMTAFGNTEMAIEATKMGAFDFILKPFEIPAILELIDKGLKAGHFMRQRVSMDVSPAAAPSDAIIGRSPVMQELYKSIGRAAPTEATVLIRGESGTGKELIARAIYQHSLRADHPFLIINCVAIPDTLLESELFGYEKGAFTGAVSRRVGKIEQAHRGTVFLDEIGDMPIEIQAKILRLLQERSIERLGGGKPINVDVRIIAATNRDLEAAVAEGRFREDLYYRLKVVTLNAPPLRARIEDIPLLADYFLARFAADMSMTNPGITDDAKAVLKAYAWPGNVRELANTLQKALIFSRGGPLGAGDIFPGTGQGEPQARPKAAAEDEKIEKAVREWARQEMAEHTGDNVFDALMDRFGSLLIREALTLTDGNRTRAAKLLGLSRPTLLSKINKYDLKIGTSVS
ncbi:MAG: sigma-54 dependent transcriptional regulator [Proteobacteria bacterium]|nr:sigma-54 dependent transcriptional regulator [Pseudomonadota bacterium]